MNNSFFAAITSIAFIMSLMFFCSCVPTEIGGKQRIDYREKEYQDKAILALGGDPEKAYCHRYNTYNDRCYFQVGEFPVVLTCEAQGCLIID